VTTSLLLACLWVLAATAIALMPRRFHVPGAIGLTATGIPLLGLVTWENGALAGVLATAAAASVLRWPLFHLSALLRKALRREG